MAPALWLFRLTLASSSAYRAVLISSSLMYFPAKKDATPKMALDKIARLMIIIIVK